MTTQELIAAKVESAKADWPAPFEGGNHVMRYVGAEYASATACWKVYRDETISGIRLNRHDAKAIVRIAAALTRFIDQVGADNIAALVYDEQS